MEKNNQDGFTLFELIIVLVIMGLVTGLAIPRVYKSLSHVELKSAARRTMVLLNEARDIAYFQKTRIKVSLDPDEDKITVWQYTDKKFELISSIGYAYPNDIRIKEYQKRDEKIVHGRFDILFSSKGSSSGGIISLGSRNRTYRIEVDPITGDARILQ